MDSGKGIFGWARRLKTGLVQPEFLCTIMEILLLWLGAVMAVGLLVVMSGGPANANALTDISGIAPALFFSGE
jgi:hypothetical protein